MAARLPPVAMRRPAAAAAASPAAARVEALLDAAQPGEAWQVTRVSRIQSLWAGYGEALEVFAVDGAGAPRRLVAKLVSAPAGAPGDVGHARKVRSYEVEAEFYASVAPALRAAGVALPEPLAVDRAGGAVALVLEDLRGAGFPEAHRPLDVPRLEAALSWLAALHATHFGRPLPPGLWPEGTYYHLETRREELGAIDREWAPLRDAANEIDRRLCAGAPRFRTLLHGDAKQTNALFGERDGRVVAAFFDYQYTGGGDGMRDVAYLICSSAAPAAAERHRELLAHYHSELLARLGPVRGAEVAAEYTVEVMEARFDLALADLTRWMAGRAMQLRSQVARPLDDSPAASASASARIGWGFWGCSSWAQRRTREFLKML
jgi:Ser/Thr protein kinase RdoA (MazF antagonist)